MLSCQMRQNARIDQNRMGQDAVCSGRLRRGTSVNGTQMYCATWFELNVAMSTKGSHPVAPLPLSTARTSQNCIAVECCLFLRTPAFKVPAPEAKLISWRVRKCDFCQAASRSSIKSSLSPWLKLPGGVFTSFSVIHCSFPLHSQWCRSRNPKHSSAQH